jgi:hypothetical protein
MFQRLAVLSMVFLLLSSVTIGCAHNVKITSKPEGADCHVKDMYIGKTPVIYRAHSGPAGSLQIKLKKEGYKPLTFKARSHYKADLSLLWLIPGIVPYFVGTAEYKDQYTFKLRKK